MGIAVRGRPSYILVEERCRSDLITILTTDNGGQWPEARQGEEVLGQVGIHAAQHFLPIIQPYDGRIRPYLYGLIWGVAGP